MAEILTSALLVLDTDKSALATWINVLQVSHICLQLITLNAMHNIKIETTHEILKQIL